MGGLEGRRKSHSDRKKLKFLTNKNERENGDFRKYAKDKNYPAHFRKKCPLECEGIKTFVQNQIFCPKECERVVTFPVYENNTKEA